MSEPRPPSEEEKCAGLAEKPTGGWFVEGFNDRTYAAETNQGLCACDQKFDVSDQYHWHDSKGVCHNRVKCQ